MKKGIIKLPTPSLESLVEDVQNYNVVSNEGLSDLFNAVVDNSKSAFTRVTNFNSEKAYNDAVEDKFQVMRFMAGFNNTDLAKIVIVVPDRFTGNMPILVSDLNYAYDTFVGELMSAVGTIDADISNSINNANDGELVVAPASIVPMRRLKKKRIALHDKISKNFVLTRTKTHSTIIEHFKSPSEVNSIYPLLKTVEATFSRVSMEKLIVLSEGITGKIQILIERLETLGPSVRSDLNLKEVTESITELGKSLEFVGYLQATLLQVYGSVNSMGKNVINYYNQ